ncbi:MAG TPA: hypothetical protein VE007_08065 [Thermoanaerobaculia bacterium]|nr:hypothetical protein [Thermoanaerobaculia bacterium]
MIARARTVDAMTREAARMESVRKADLCPGDRLLVATTNSVYEIGLADDALYSISGGWFDRQGIAPAKMSIAGCTWGGSAIHRDIVAARGLRLEFGNRVVTSTIRQVRIIRRELFGEPLDETVPEGPIH